MAIAFDRIRQFQVSVIAFVPIRQFEVRLIAVVFVPIRDWQGMAIAFDRIRSAQVTDPVQVFVRLPPSIEFDPNSRSSSDRRTLKCPFSKIETTRRIRLSPA
jgi:hypothetical protein